MGKSDNRILHAHSGTKIRDLQDLGKLGAMIHNWAVMLGIRETPSDAEKGIAVAFLRNHFGDLSVSDITVALELAAAGELVDDPHHYQSFSIIYLGQVLRAYRDRLAYEMRESGKKPALPEPAEDEAKLNRESWEGLRAYVGKFGKMPFIWDWARAYFHLEDTGQVTESDEELKRIIAQAKQEWDNINFMKPPHHIGPADSFQIFKFKKYLEIKLKPKA